MVGERAYWLAWSQINGIGPVLLGRLQEKFGTLAAAWQANAIDLKQVEGFGPKIIEAVVNKRSQIDPLKFIEEHSIKNPNFWTPADREYPRLLLEIPHPPSVIYYQGQSEILNNHNLKPIIGIVGTREPSEYGRRWTRRLSNTLAKRGFTIVSGMAAGIDAEAHRGCLEAGGHTLAVLGTGVDIVYPPSNKGIYQQILKQGIVISEYSAGTKPDRTHFPRRNRIIAGLCRAILVMEAPQKSGALITANLANDFGRDVYILPGRLDDYQAIGCLSLLSKGAQVILSENHLLEMLGEIPPIQASEQLELFADAGSKITPQPKINLEPELAMILQAVDKEPMYFDFIVEKSGLNASTVASALVQLELMGLVVQLPGMRYQLV